MSCAVASLCLCWTASDDICRQLGKNCKDWSFCSELQNYICRQLRENCYVLWERGRFRCENWFQCFSLLQCKIQNTINNCNAGCAQEEVVIEDKNRLKTTWVPSVRQLRNWMWGGDVSVRGGVALEQGADHIHQEDDGDQDLQDDCIVLEGDQVVHDPGHSGSTEVAEGERGGEQSGDDSLHLVGEWIGAVRLQCEKIGLAVGTSMLSGKPASIAAIWAEPKLATRRAEEPKPKKKKESEEAGGGSENCLKFKYLDHRTFWIKIFLITLENKRPTDAAKRCLKEWKVDDRTWNSSC